MQGSSSSPELLPEVVTRKENVERTRHFIHTPQAAVLRGSSPERNPPTLPQDELANLPDLESDEHIRRLGPISQYGDGDGSFWDRWLTHEQPKCSSFASGYVAPISGFKKRRADLAQHRSERDQHRRINASKKSWSSAADHSRLREVGVLPKAEADALLHYCVVAVGGVGESPDALVRNDGVAATRLRWIDDVQRFHRRVAGLSTRPSTSASSVADENSTREGGDPPLETRVDMAIRVATAEASELQRSFINGREVRRTKKHTFGKLSDAVRAYRTRCLDAGVVPCALVECALGAAGSGRRLAVSLPFQGLSDTHLAVVCEAIIAHAKDAVVTPSSNTTVPAPLLKMAGTTLRSVTLDWRANRDGGRMCGLALSKMLLCRIPSTGESGDNGAPLVPLDCADFSEMGAGAGSRGGAIAALCGALATLGKDATVRRLYLRSDGVADASDASVKICEAVAACPLLTVLDVARNRLGRKFARRIGDALVMRKEMVGRGRGLGCEAAVCMGTLLLPWNNLGDTGVCELLDSMEKSASPLGLQTLDIAFNGIAPRGGVAVANSLGGDAGSLHGLVHLDLSNNRLGPETGAALALALRGGGGGCSALKVLRVGFNPLGFHATADIVRSISNVVFTPSMRELGVENTLATAAGGGGMSIIPVNSGEIDTPCASSNEVIDDSGSSCLSEREKLILCAERANVERISQNRQASHRSAIYAVDIALEFPRRHSINEKLAASKRPNLVGQSPRLCSEEMVNDETAQQGASPLYRLSSTVAAVADQGKGPLSCGKTPLLEKYGPMSGATWNALKVSVSPLLGSLVFRAKARVTAMAFRAETIIAEAARKKSQISEDSEAANESGEIVAHVRGSTQQAASIDAAVSRRVARRKVPPLPSDEDLVASGLERLNRVLNAEDTFAHLHRVWRGAALVSCAWEQSNDTADWAFDPLVSMLRTSGFVDTSTATPHFKTPPIWLCGDGDENNNVVHDDNDAAAAASATAQVFASPETIARECRAAHPIPNRNHDDAAKDEARVVSSPCSFSLQVVGVSHLRQSRRCDYICGH